MLARSRRSLRLAAVGVLLTAPVLASCGFDEATNRVNQITAGQTVQDGVVDLSNVLVVAEEEGSGTLVGLMHNASSQETITLDSVTSEGITVPEETIELLPLQRGLLEDAGLRVEGDFGPGNVLPMTFGFDNGEQVSVNVQVVRACDEYTGYDDAPPAGGVTLQDLVEADAAAEGAEGADGGTEVVDCGVDTDDEDVDVVEDVEEEEAE